MQKHTSNVLCRICFRNKQIMCSSATRISTNVKMATHGAMLISIKMSDCKHTDTLKQSQWNFHAPVRCEECFKEGREWWLWLLDKIVAKFRWGRASHPGPASMSIGHRNDFPRRCGAARSWPTFAWWNGTALMAFQTYGPLITCRVVWVLAACMNWWWHVYRKYFFAGNLRY